MGEENKSALVPRLRFPEFRTQRPWERKELAQLLTTISNGVSLPQNNSGRGLRVTRIETIADGTIDLDRVGYVDALEKELEDYRLNIGDVLLSNINSIAHIGKSILVDADHDLYHGMNLLRLKVDAKLNSPQFVYFSINTPAVRNSIRGRANKAVNQASINQTELGRTIIPSPSRAEQQKIADCLSSLDELITAETQKLAALKTHKKGLMQQLFPREGETVPRLRFPEFREAGEWVREALTECLEKVIDYRGKAPPKSESGVPLITARNVRFGWLDMSCDEYIDADVFESWMSKGIPKGGDILFTTEAPLGNVALFPPEGKFALGQRIITLRTRTKKCLPEFLFQSLLGPQMQKEIDFHSTGSTAKGIKSAVFVNLCFCHPEIPEQQKIADRLSSLDNLVTAQSQKIDALKTHKQGLMQQLFPVMG